MTCNVFSGTLNPTQSITINHLTGDKILGCELHQNAFGGRAPSGPAGGAIALPQTL